jgi:hypothetical protein
MNSKSKKRLTITVVTVAVLIAAAVFCCRRAGKDPVPTGVQHVTTFEQIERVTDHLTVVGVEVDAALLAQAANDYAGRVEFVTVDKDNFDVIMPLGIDTEMLPVVKFILAGGASDECLMGDISKDELYRMIDERLAAQPSEE